METAILIKQIDEKQAKTGKLYHSVDTDVGKMTCFEEAVVKDLKEYVGKKVLVEVVEQGKFKNIRAFIKPFDPEVINPLEKPKEAVQQIVIHKTERPNSYEFGKAGNRIKVYFDTAQDLNEQITALQELGYGAEDPIEPVEDVS